MRRYVLTGHLYTPEPPSTHELGGSIDIDQNTIKGLLTIDDDLQSVRGFVFDTKKYCMQKVFPERTQLIVLSYEGINARTLVVKQDGEHIPGTYTGVHAKTNKHPNIMMALELTKQFRKTCTDRVTFTLTKTQ